MHIAIFEAYCRNVPFTAAQVAWLKANPRTKIMRDYYLRHYYAHQPKEPKDATVKT